MDDPPGDTKSIDDMVFDEVDYVNSLNFDERYHFRLLRKVVGNFKDVPMSFC